MRVPSPRGVTPHRTKVLLLPRLVVLVLAWLSAATASAQQPLVVLAPGETLQSGQSWTTPDHRYRLTNRADGLLVFHVDEYPLDPPLGGDIGAGPGVLQMQTDGNLVFTQNGVVTWHTFTGGLEGHGVFLQLNPDGNLVLNDNGAHIWASHTDWAEAPSWWMGPNRFLNPGDERQSASGRYRFANQIDGRLVLSLDGHEVWSSSPAPGVSGQLWMQDDGNLVLYRYDGTTWHETYTNGNYWSHLEIDHNGSGTIQIISATGAVLWAAPTTPPSLDPRLTINGAKQGETVIVRSNHGVTVNVTNAPGGVSQHLRLFRINAGTVTDLATVEFGDQSGNFAVPVPANKLPAAGYVFVELWGYVNEELVDLANGPGLSIVAVTLTVNGKLAPLNIAGNQPLNVHVPNNTAGQREDWIGLFQVGQPDSNPTEWFYLNGTKQVPEQAYEDVTITFSAPALPNGGQLEFRFIEGSSGIVISRFSPINVTPPPLYTLTIRNHENDTFARLWANEPLELLVNNMPAPGGEYGHALILAEYNRCCTSIGSMPQSAPHVFDTSSTPLEPAKTYAFYLVEWDADQIDIPDQPNGQLGRYPIAASIPFKMLAPPRFTNVVPATGAFERGRGEGLDIGVANVSGQAGDYVGLFPASGPDAGAPVWVHYPFATPQPPAEQLAPISFTLTPEIAIGRLYTFKYFMEGNPVPMASTLPMYAVPKPTSTSVSFLGPGELGFEQRQRFIVRVQGAPVFPWWKLSMRKWVNGAPGPRVVGMDEALAGRTDGDIFFITPPIQDPAERWVITLEAADPEFQAINDRAFLATERFFVAAPNPVIIVKGQDWRSVNPVYVNWGEQIEITVVSPVHQSNLLTQMKDGEPGLLTEFDGFGTDYLMDGRPFRTVTQTIAPGGSQYIIAYASGPTPGERHPFVSGPRMIANVNPLRITVNGSEDDQTLAPQVSFEVEVVGEGLATGDRVVFQDQSAPYEQQLLWTVYDPSSSFDRKRTQWGWTSGSYQVQVRTAGGAVRKGGPVITFGQKELTDKTIRYYDSDAIGSVRLVTDASGSEVGHLDYLPFGAELAAPSDLSGLRLRFGGKELDAETRLSYFGARYYADAMGRFMTVDPEHVSGTINDPQSWNAYAYARNNPLKYVDTDGREYSICIAEYSCVNVSDAQFEQLIDNPGAGIQLFGGFVYAGDKGVGTYKRISADPTWSSFSKEVGRHSSELLQGTLTVMAVGDAAAVAAGIGIAASGGLTLEGGVSLGRAAAANANKFRHIFVPKHKLGSLVARLGSKDGLYNAVQNAAQDAVTRQGLQGVVRSLKVVVAGETLTVTGTIQAGRLIMSNFWKP